LLARKGRLRIAAEVENMSHPFPEKPVTDDVVRSEIDHGGWVAAPCCLCDRAGARWKVDGKDAYRYICPGCQRLVISGPKLAALRQMQQANPEAAAAHRRELSELAKNAHEPPEFTSGG